MCSQGLAVGEASITVLTDIGADLGMGDQVGLTNESNNIV